MRLRTNGWILCCGVGLILALALPSISSAVPPNVRAAAGVYGVYGIPVVQDDVGAGALFGGKVRADLVGPLGAEVSFTSFPGYDVSEFDTQLGSQTTKGWSHSVIALNAILQTTGVTGFGVYVTGGVGSYKMTKDYADDLSRIGYNFGLGCEYRMTMGLAVDVSGRLHAAPLEDGGSHKFAAIQAGINYYFLR
jgi:opacity protein-like surface antigen